MLNFHTNSMNNKHAKSQNVHMQVYI